MLQKTPLHESHVALGAKMGGFAGYDMPLFYKAGVMAEHIWTRSNVGIFDVSHMGQVTIEGAGSVEFLERITPSSFQNKKDFRAQYTVLTNEQGGIVDDLIITRLSKDKFFLVINAGCKEKDIAWIKKNLPSGLKFENLSDRALIAVQGPGAERLLHEVLRIDTQGLGYMNLMQAALDGNNVFVSRLGYTGEDGFEISVPPAAALPVWNKLLNHTSVKPIGLAARDSLRLEMGYPLYGHDISDETSPIEAGLEWVMRKDNTDFIGGDRTRRDREQGIKQQRVGIRLLDKGVAREGAEIHDASGNKVGALTSGGFSPTLQQAIGQGYIDSALAATGTKIFVNVRGRPIPAEVAALPFVEPKTRAARKKAA